jgi:hypothetical protein
LIPITSDEIQRWRVEIDNAEKFKEDEFGKYRKGEQTKAGENLDYFDFGLPDKYRQNTESDGVRWVMSLFNVIHVIIKNVIPTLYYKNPYVLAMPKRHNQEDEQSAPYAGGILNYYHKELDLKYTNKQTLFNGYGLGMGVSKLGYTTKFGTMPTEASVKEEQKQRAVSKQKGILEKLGLRKRKPKPKPEDDAKQNPELNEYIRSESPFIVDVSPFRFGIDPRATDIRNANFVYEIIPKRLKDVKSNKEYVNTKDLKGEEIDYYDLKKVPQTQIDEFKIINIVEVYYKTEEGLNLLVLALDGDQTKALRHDKFIINIDGFPYELLYFNKHPHRLYPVSDIEKIKELQDRVTNTLDNILEQLDKYVPKLFVDETALTDSGKRTVQSPTIGGVVFTNKNPNDCVKSEMFIQLKADLVAFIDKLLEIVMLMTGLTKAQMLGLTQAETATEAQIGQAGQNLRMSDKFDSVTDFLNRQSRKLWQIARQFVDFEEISLILGEQQVDNNTGMVQYSWMPDITSDIAGKLARGEYRFEIEVGSTEKPDLAILRKQVENFVNILGGKGVLEAIAAQGYKIELVEIIREYLKLFPDMFSNPGRIIKPIQQPMMPGQPGAGGGAQGVRPQQRQANPPTSADLMSAVGGEKGGNVPIA